MKEAFLKDPTIPTTGLPEERIEMPGGEEDFLPNLQAGPKDVRTLEYEAISARVAFTDAKLWEEHNCARRCRRCVVGASLTRPSVRRLLQTSEWNWTPLPLCLMTRGLGVPSHVQC